MYFKYNFNMDGTKNWDESYNMPDNAQLLVRAVGLNFVHEIFNSIEAYRNKIKGDVVIFTEAERKDDVSFFVKPNIHKDITSFIRDFVK